MPPPYPAVYKPQIIVSPITVDGKKAVPEILAASYSSYEGSPEGLRLPVNSNDPVVSVLRTIDRRPLKTSAPSRLAHFQDVLEMSSSGHRLIPAGD